MNDLGRRLPWWRQSWVALAAAVAILQFDGTVDAMKAIGLYFGAYSACCQRLERIFKRLVLTDL